MMTKSNVLLAILIATIVIGCSNGNNHQKKQTFEEKQLTATSYFSGFDLAHDTYNAISAASDGKIYYVLSSQPYDVAGQVH
ncbi:MAG: hypothetical protein ACOYEG_11405, partial [Petrimonas sp.]